MPSIDDLEPERRARVHLISSQVSQIHQALVLADPGMAQVFDLLGMAVVSLTARAEYVEQRLAALEHPDRNDHA